VNGGVGLQPDEHALVLDARHWLVEQVAVVGRALALEDTAEVRRHLAGAPLATWRYLLAVPVPVVRAVVILARGRDLGPFTDTALTALANSLKTAAEQLESAMRTRHLARLLAPLSETTPTT
jgi:hypothetical protein